MKTAKQVMKADACSLFLVDKETSELNIHIALSDVSDKLKEISSVIPIKVGEGIAGKVAQTGKALIIKDAYEHPSFNPEFDKHTGFKTGAILCSPLHVQNQLVGVCEVINHSSRRSKFNGKDLGLFQMFCQSAALAVQNAQSHNALIKIERIEKEMEISSVVQSSFLPQEIPQTQRFSFAADSVPARMVGGDFYDFIQVDQDHMAVLMGDVSGKGVSAALFMARLMSDFRYVSQIDPDPSKVLEGVNSILCTRARGGMFTTAFYMLVNLKKRTLQTANAGHPPLLIKTEKGTVLEKASASGPPLGIVPGISYPSQQITLKKGQWGTLFTDGVIEPKNKKNNHFGMKRLCDILGRDVRSPGLLIKKIQTSVSRFTGGGIPFDDMTILTFEVL